MVPKISLRYSWINKDVMIVGKDGKPHNQRRWTEKGKYFIMSVSL